MQFTTPLPPLPKMLIFMWDKNNYILFFQPHSTPLTDELILCSPKMAFAPQLMLSLPTQHEQIYFLDFAQVKFTNDHMSLHQVQVIDQPSTTSFTKIKTCVQPRLNPYFNKSQQLKVVFIFVIHKFYNNPTTTLIVPTTIQLLMHPN